MTNPAALALPAAHNLAPLPTALREAAEQGAALAAKARSEATDRAYKRAWSAWEAWALSHGLTHIPAAPPAVGAYVGHMAGEGLKPASVALALAAISDRHRAAGLPSPREAAPVRDALAGLRRTHGTAPAKAEAITADALRRICRDLPADPAGVRDRAMLLIGFAALLRRSEIAALDVEDLRFVSGGVEVHIRRSKTDQAGAGAVVAVHVGVRPETCPVRALRDWLVASGAKGGPLFRSFEARGRGAPVLTERRISDRDVSRVLKRRAAGAELPAEALSGHSLRRGAATTAAALGADLRTVADLGRWKSLEVARGYVEEGQRFARNPLAGAL